MLTAKDKYFNGKKNFKLLVYKFSIRISEKQGGLSFRGIESLLSLEKPQRF